MLNKGILYALGAYLLWGFLPVYWKALQSVPAPQILAHRMVWSFVFLSGVILVRREWSSLKDSLTDWRVIAQVALSACLLAVNWLIYIWGVNTGHILETSLGYFINPLLSVALGVVFMRERLRPLQWLPVGLAAAGVLYLTIQYGELPWIALALASSFGLYGLLKKIVPLSSLYSLTTETAILFVPFLLFLLYLNAQGGGAFGRSGTVVNLLLALTGVVTAMPLLLFGAAARSIPLSMVGILQYLAPTCQLLLGVMVYGEPFDRVRLVGFSAIWIALLIFWLEGALQKRQALSSS
jgi:chloramphenicol-sensitive protein RarD